MKAKEIKLIIMLSLVVTVIINALLICNTDAFSLVKLFIKSNENFNSFAKGDDKVLSDLSKSVSLDTYKENRDFILKTIGKINTYRISNIFKNFSREKNKITIDYEIKSEWLPEWTGISMVYGHEGNKWKLSRIDIQGHESFLISSQKAANNINTVNSIADKVINAYIASDYDYIYSIMCDELKKSKKKEDLASYFNYAKNRYGEIGKESDPTMEPSRKGDEYKLTYLIGSERIRNLSLIVWIQVGDTCNLSGIKFAESVW